MTDEPTRDRPITWREFRNLRVIDIKEGDLVLLDPVFGIQHVTRVEDFTLPNGTPVRQLQTESRSLAFPHLAYDVEHYEEQRFVPGSCVRDVREPCLIVHTVHPRNPKLGSLD